MIESKINELLINIESPSRYTGHELNAIVKDFEQTDTKFALAFPDFYEIGMSYPGFQILYDLLNKEENVLASRVFTPHKDLEDEMIKQDIPLFCLEYWQPLDKYDFLGFSLQYEMSFPTVLHMMNLANIPLRSKDRLEDDPLIIAGGPCVFNAEPVADFFDIIILGEAEEVLIEIIDIYHDLKKSNYDKESYLQAIKDIQGVYIPKYFKIEYSENASVKSIVNLEGENTVKKRIVKSLDQTNYPTKPVIPYIDVPHERMVLELFRGCLRGCRFCQAGFIYRPVREREVATLVDQAKKLYENTGYEELSLMSLSTGDYSQIKPLLHSLNDEFGEKYVNLSLPSLRVDSYDIELAKEAQKVRRSGLTLAPEAGTQRMRDIINKQVTEEDLITTVAAAVENGWTRVKLYFMIGLPTEKDEDLEAIVDLAEKVARLGKNGPMQVTVSVAGFVPKPHTPFQWVKQDTIEELQRKQQYILNLLKRKKYIKLNYHDAYVTHIEGVLARGDRRLSLILEEIVNQGAWLESWDEHFDYQRWKDAFAKYNIQAQYYVARDRTQIEIFPWDHLDSGVKKSYLWQEYEKSLSGECTADCREQGCSFCGVCPSLDSKIRLAGQ